MTEISSVGWLHQAGMKYPFLMRQLPMEGHVFRDFACGDRHMVAVTTVGAIYEWGDRRHIEPRNSLLIFGMRVEVET